MLKRRVYLIAFSFVAFCTLLGATLRLLECAGVRVDTLDFLWFRELFSHPLPLLVRQFLPALVNLVLFWLFVGLLLRRLAVFAKNRALILPLAFSRIPYVLTCIALASLALSALGMLVSIAIHAGSGVPAGMLGIVATILLSPVVAWVELRSLFAARLRNEP